MSLNEKLVGHGGVASLPESGNTVPWSQRLSFNIIFFHLEICGAKRWSKCRVGRKRKPLVATVENLTFMLVQHLTAVKDFIFFWPITKGGLIYNLLTGPGGSVLRYSEINYFVGRGEKRLPCLCTSQSKPRPPPHPGTCGALVGLYHHIGNSLSPQYVGD